MSPATENLFFHSEFFLWLAIITTLLIYHDFLNRVLGYPFQPGRRALKGHEKESYRVGTI